MKLMKSKRLLVVGKWTGNRVKVVGAQIKEYLIATVFRPWNKMQGVLWL